MTSRFYTVNVHCEQVESVSVTVAVEETKKRLAGLEKNPDLFENLALDAAYEKAQYIPSERWHGVGLEYSADNAKRVMPDYIA